VAGTVGDSADEGRRPAGEREQPVHDLAVGRRCAGADVVDLAGHTVGEQQDEGGAVIVDVDPVPLVEPVSVDGDGPPLLEVRDGERDELVGQLERPVVVGAPAHDDGQAVAVVVGEGDEVGTGLRRGVGRAWREGVGLP
jgi:hypothetical protein